jgi:hypothetical protein
MKPSGYRAPGAWRGLPALCLAFTLALLMAACGPGVGGTGTGPSAAGTPASDPAVAAADLCASDLAVLLACGGGSSATAPQAGTAAADWADAMAPHRVSVHFEGQGIELDAPCAGLLFSGQWGVVAGQTARFHGHAGSEPATLLAVTAGSGLSVQVFDVQGRTLFGPQLVERQTAAVAASCR